jgi:hypothetical protein
MSIRIDPRRLTFLKELAGGEGLRPGQLVQRWVEERLDAEREGRPVAAPEGAARLATLEASVAALAARVEALVQGGVAGAASAGGAAPGKEGAAPGSAAVAPDDRPRRRGRPPSAAGAGAMPGTMKRRPPAAAAGEAHVPLHEEIIAVIAERGPSTAAEIAEAILERDRYHAPRSSRPLDAATVNSRVSNPVYRARFVRAGRRIGLAG